MANKRETVSDYGGPYRLHSTHILHSATFDRYIGQDVGRMQHQHLLGDQHWLSSHPQPQPQPHPYSLFQPHPYPYPYPHARFPLHPPHHHHLYSAESHDFHQAILREIEKERIRQEIIMSEIIRRRGLEAEVRREIMMDREMAIQGGSNGFLEKRIMLPLTQRDVLNDTQEGGGSESLPFQRASNDVRTAINSEDKPVLDGSIEKKKIILQVKPIENITGAKRARSGPNTSESESDGKLKKKAKEEWSCALCQVSTPTEHILNKHLGGKKHKRNEAALIAQKAGKSSGQRVRTNKVAKSIKGLGTSNPVTDSEVKLASESLPFGRSGDASSRTDGPPPLHVNLNSDNLKKDKPVVPQEVQNNNQPKKIKSWCKICRTGVGSQKMDEHEQGKKHKRQLKHSNGVGIVGPSNQKKGGAAGGR